EVVAAIARSVLAQMPAFFFEPALARCYGQLTLWRLLPVGRIEDREVPTDDLLRGVAAERLGAPTPAGDAPFGIEHVDRAILDCVDDEPRALLALAQRLFDLASRLNVLEQPRVGHCELAGAATSGLEKIGTKCEQCRQHGAQSECRLGQAGIRALEEFVGRRNAECP